jgi:hypothetical protein
MRIKLFFILFSIAAAAALSSCRSADRKAQLSQADSLLNAYDSIAFRLSAIDTLAIAHAWKAFGNVSDSFNLYYDDSYHETTWERSRLFAEIKSPLKFVNRNYSRVQKSMGYSVTQLQGLRKDIRRGKWTNEEIGTYLATEREEMLKIEQELNLLVQNAEVGLQLYQERIGPMRELVDSMKNNAAE